MKPCIKVPLPALIATLGSMLAGLAAAQNFAVLHTFTGSDGVGPVAGLIFRSNTLYGTANSGGSSGNGTVFRVNTDGTGFTNLYNFTTNSEPFYTNSDGATPYAGLILAGNTLFGTAESGGNSGQGTVFSLNTD